MAEVIDREKLAGCYISIVKAEKEGWAAILLGHISAPGCLIEYADDPVAAVVRLARCRKARLTADCYDCNE